MPPSDNQPRAARGRRRYGGVRRAAAAAAAASLSSLLAFDAACAGASAKSASQVDAAALASAFDDALGVRKAAYRCAAYCPLGLGQKNIAEFRCQDGDCIDIKHYCDGEPTCRDGSDEVDCAPRPAQEYDCIVGYTNWRRVWSMDKKKYCCEKKGRGCPSVAGHRYDCLADPGALEEWPKQKRSYCCDVESIGCTTSQEPVLAAPRREPYNCRSGEDTSIAPWPMGKRVWCCQNRGVNCGALSDPPPTLEPRPTTAPFTTSVTFSSSLKEVLEQAPDATLQGLLAEARHEAAAAGDAPAGDAAHASDGPKRPAATSTSTTETETETSTETVTQTETKTSTETTTETSTSTTESSTSTETTTTTQTTTATATTTSSTSKTRTRTTTTETRTTTLTTTLDPISLTMSCSEENVAYEPLDMPGQMFRKVDNVAQCQALCARTLGCVHFAFWTPAGDCHFQDEFAYQTEMLDFVSGPASCSQGSVEMLEVVPTFKPIMKFSRGAGPAAAAARGALLGPVGAGLLALLLLVGSASLAAFFFRRRPRPEQRLFSRRDLVEERVYNMISQSPSKVENLL